MKIVIAIVAFLTVLSCASALRINCDYNYKMFPIIFQKLEVEVTSISTSEPNQNITDYYNFCKSNNYEAILIKSKSVSYLPRNIKDFFNGNMKVVSVISSGLKEITKEDLIQFDQLVLLNLTDNQLQVIEKNLFQHNQNLQLIDLSKNPLKSVAESSFTSLNSLAYLNFTSCECLNRNFNGQELIREFFEDNDLQYDGFCSNAQSSMIEVIKTNLDSTSKLLYTSMNNKTSHLREFVRIKCFNIRSGLCRAVLEVKLPNSLFSTQTIFTNVSGLKIYNQKMIFIPFGLATIMPNLSSINITNNGIFAVSNITFRDLNNLTELSLSNNEFSELISDNFGNLTSLTLIDLSSNQLETLHDDSFVHLINLKSLNLKQNLIKSLNWRILRNLKNLLNFDISGNQLNSISTRIIDYLGKPIENLNFEDNECIKMKYPNNLKEEIKNSIISNCVRPKPMHCNFSTESFSIDDFIIYGYSCAVDNFLVEDEGMMISDIFGPHKVNYTISDVNSIIFDNQNLEFIPKNLFSIFPNLKSLIINESKLSQLSEGDLKNLQVIKISGNDLKVQPKAFDGNSQLDFLDLSNNSIKSLPNDIFLSNGQLRTLKLSHNNITDLSASIIATNNEISSFQIDQNNLETVDARIMKKLKNAKLIDFSGNDCYDGKFVGAEKNPTQNRKKLLEMFTEINFVCSAV